MYTRDYSSRFELSCAPSTPAACPSCLQKPRTPLLPAALNLIGTVRVYFARSPCLHFPPEFPCSSENNSMYDSLRVCISTARYENTLMSALMLLPVSRNMTCCHTRSERFLLCLSGLFTVGYIYIPINVYLPTRIFSVRSIYSVMGEVFTTNTLQVFSREPEFQD